MTQAQRGTGGALCPLRFRIAKTPPPPLLRCGPPACLILFKTQFNGRPGLGPNPGPGLGPRAALEAPPRPIPSLGSLGPTLRVSLSAPPLFRDSTQPLYPKL